MRVSASEQQILLSPRGSTIASFLLPRHVRAFYIGFAICGLYGLNGGYEGTLTGKCVSILSSKLSEIYSENTSSTAESSTTVNPYSPPMLSGQFGIIVNKYCQEWVTAWAVLFVGFLGGCFASWLSAKRERDEQAATNKSG